jgi:hypothetical protein
MDYVAASRHMNPYRWAAEDKQLIQREPVFLY